MDAWGHHLPRRSAAGIEAVLSQAFADDVAVGHHPDQLVFLSNRNGAYVMLTHQFREVGDRGVGPTQSTPLCIASLTFMVDLLDGDRR
jgi:hypothetical protein